MKQKAKVCLIGATAVGKSSLVARYVHSIFSEGYRTTIGVKIETHTVPRDGDGVEFVLWDLSGEDEFQNVQPSYLRGASGYLLVIDGTRRETLEVAFVLEQRVREAVGSLPFVIVLNKSDLSASWDLSPRDLDTMTSKGWVVVLASAKTGAGVDESFERLAAAIRRRASWS
jgi:small GTP-binding protein